MRSVAIKTLRLLSLLEQSPKYGQQLCRLAPEIFGGRQRAVASVGRLHDGRIYMVMGRAEAAGLIQRLPNYKPPPAEDVPKRSVDRVVWYGITSQGRKALREAREVLQIKVGA